MIFIYKLTIFQMSNIGLYYKMKKKHNKATYKLKQLFSFHFSFIVLEVL